MKLSNDIGLKNRVSLDDALSVLEVWRRSEQPFRARYYCFAPMPVFCVCKWSENIILYLGEIFTYTFELGIRRVIVR